MNETPANPTPPELPTAAATTTNTTLREAVAPTPNLPMGIVAGSVAALIGAILWAVVTDVTKYQIGWMAVGVGVLVGFAVRKFGRGSTPTFSLIGASLALIGCLLGNLLAVIGLVAIEQNVGFFDALRELSARSAVDVLTGTFAPMDLLFYGIAVYEGFKLSIVKEAPTQTA